MEDTSQPARGSDPVGDRLSRLSAASLRINESLDFDVVLQGALDSARSLTGARYGVMTLLGDGGMVEDFLASGLSDEESELLWLMPEGLSVFQALTGISEPMRVPDLTEHTRALGFTDFTIPLPVGVFTFLAAPMFHRGVRVGHVFLGDREDGQEFSREDEETLALFASQAAQVIANARARREEPRQGGPGDADRHLPGGRRRLRHEEGRRGVVQPGGKKDSGRSAGPGLGAGGPAGTDRCPPRRRERGLPAGISPGQDPPLQRDGAGRADRHGRPRRTQRYSGAQRHARSLRRGGGGVGGGHHAGHDGRRGSGAAAGGVPGHGEPRAQDTPRIHQGRGLPPSWTRRRDLDPAETRQFHRIIVDQADQMRELIGDLLDVARIETGSLAVDPEPTEAALLVDRARNAYQGAGGTNDLAIDVVPGLPQVMADRGRVVQVIGNLLSNAARHSPNDSVILVSAVNIGGQVEFSVADQGRGIPAADLPLLFRRFSRAEGRDTGGDVGLGLAICKGIVEAHGGRIRAESDGPGLGARFSFTLPAVGDAELPSHAARAHEDGPFEGTALAVDDDPLTLRSVRDALASAGFRTVVTADPEEALELVAEHRPRLALLDLMLPERDGVELMGDIMAVSHIPVIFLSAYGRDEMVARALEEGADDYIVKPFSPTELVARVRAVLRRSEEPERPARSEPFTVGDLRIDYAGRRVTVSDNPVELTATEFDLLAELVAEAGRVVSHDRLLRRVWSPGKPGNLRVLRTHMRRLRRKLGEDAASPRYILTEPRVGYRMSKGDGVVSS